MSRDPRGFVRWVAAFALCAAAAATAWAQSLDGYLELTATRTDESTQFVGSVPVETDVDSLIQRLNFLYLQPLAPNLNLLLGGFFERETPEGTVAGTPTDSETQRLRPFGRLRLYTRTIQADLGFERNESRQEASLPQPVPESRLVRDAVGANLAWYPDSRNFVQIRANRSTEQDKPRSQLDRELSEFSLNSQYQPVEWLRVQYRGAFGTTDDKLNRVETERLTNNLRFLYSDSFLNGRLALNSDYNVTRLDGETIVRGEGDIDLRLFATAGLSVLSDIPQFVPLLPNPALVDTDRTAPAGINLGVPPPAGDDRLRNFGLDFGVTPRINLLHVWVDRDVRPEVAPTLSWQIWVSGDNENWILHQDLGAAPFGPFDNRFELVFAPVVARYIKVVVAPLEPTIPFATEYADLLVTELEAFERIPASEVAQEERRTTQFFAFNARVRLLPVRLLFYDLNYQLNTATGSEDRWNLNNALSGTHNFSRIWSGAARLANERGAEGDRDRNADVFSASLTAAPSELLRATGIYSGRRETVGSSRQDTDTLLFNVLARPYTGVDVNVSAGGSVQEDQTQRRTRSALVNATVGITPNRYLGFNVSYLDGSRRTTRPGFPEFSDPNKAAEISVTLNPFPTLYAFASFRREERTATGRRDLRNYNVSWTPFPYGSLWLSFVFSEFQDSDRDTVTRIWGPTVRWMITRASFVDLSYQETTTDSTDQIIDRGIYTGVLRVAF